MELLKELKRLGLQVDYCVEGECMALRGEREYRIKLGRDRLEVWRHEPDESMMYEDFAESCADKYHDEDSIDKCADEMLQKELDYWNEREEKLVCDLGRVKLFMRYAAVEGDDGVDVYRVLSAVGEIDVPALLPFMINYV